MRGYIRLKNRKSLPGGDESALGEFEYVEGGRGDILGRGNSFYKETEAGNTEYVWNVKC